MPTTTGATALDLTDGAIRWNSQTRRPSCWSPASVGGTVAVVGGLLVPTGDRLIELDLQNGDIRWQIDAAHPIDAPPAVVDRTLIIVGTSGQRSAMR